jgi:hypothetical protein
MEYVREDGDGYEDVSDMRKEVIDGARDMIELLTSDKVGHGNFSHI